MRPLTGGQLDMLGGGERRHLADAWRRSKAGGVTEGRRRECREVEPASAAPATMQENACGDVVGFWIGTRSIKITDRPLSIPLSLNRLQAFRGASRLFHDPTRILPITHHLQLAYTDAAPQ